MDKNRLEAIAKAGRVTTAYVRMILAGDRAPSLPLAVRIYDGTGEALGPLSGLTADEIAVARKMAQAA